MARSACDPASGAAACVLWVLAWGCAQQASPPGGPVDDSAPGIAVVSPALLDTHVARDTPLSVTFTEPVNRDRAEDAIVVRPSVEWARREWDGPTLVLTPQGGWADSTTYSVLFRTAITDSRNIAMKESALIVFSTGAEVAAGRVAGTVRPLGLDAGSTLVFAFDRATADTNDVAIGEAIAVAEPDARGVFLLAGLPIGVSLEIGAFLDINENRGFDPSRDLYCRARTATIPDSTGGPLDIDIPLVFVDTLGMIRAVVADSTCLDLEGLLRESAQRRDSLVAARDSLLALSSTWEARIDSLLGAAVAPEAEAIDGAVVVPDSIRETTTSPGSTAPSDADSIRANVAALRQSLAALAVPDSSSIHALAVLPAEAQADSAYCRAPLVLRFSALADTIEIAEVMYGRADFDIADVPPGAYRGRLWRDLIADERFDPAQEPGTVDSITIWVPPGEAGIVDTVSIARRRAPEESP